MPPATARGEPFLVVHRGIVYNDLRNHETDANGGVTWEHNVLCVHVGPKTRLTLYENRDCGGMSFIVKRAASNPTGRFAMTKRWANEVSSLRSGPVFLIP